MKPKYLYQAARWFSSICSPFYITVIGFTFLFLFTYMGYTPLLYQLMVLLTVYGFTVLLPRLCINLYRRLNGWTSHQMGHREKRIVPYITTFFCYMGCLYLMKQYHTPYIMTGILRAALVLQIICACVNIWWKISVHTAGAGGMVGAVLAYSIIFNFNPTGWTCVLLLLSGGVASCRIILRLHNLEQVTVGFFVGLLCGYFGVIL